MSNLSDKKKRLAVKLHYPREDLYVGVDGFTRLYKEYKESLTRGFTASLGSDGPMYAEDYAHDVLLITWQCLNDIEEYRIHKFMATVASNLVYRHSNDSYNVTQVRINRYHLSGRGVDGEAHEGLDPRDFYDAIMTDVAYSYMDPEVITHHDDRYEKLMRKIKTLTKIDQFIVQNHFDRGVKIKEVADWLGISYPNARKRVQRLRESLREYFEKEKKEFAE